MGKGIRQGVRNYVAPQSQTDPLHMTVGAGQIELSATLMKRSFAGREELGIRVVHTVTFSGMWRDCRATKALRAEQLVLIREHKPERFVACTRQVLMRAFEIEQLVTARYNQRIACRDAAHAYLGVAMTARATARRCGFSRVFHSRSPSATHSMPGLAPASAACACKPWLRNVVPLGKISVLVAALGSVAISAKQSARQFMAIPSGFYSVAQFRRGPSVQLNSNSPLRVATV